MRSGERASSNGSEGEGGRRKAPGGEGRLQGRALAARDPRVPIRSLRCERCHEVRSPSALLTMAEVALRLGTSERHVRRLVAERRIPIVKVGRFVRLEEHEVEHWVDDHRVAARRSGLSLRRSS
ncbi:MAG TPA: helix-turn-helix domain-containing protein [Acidimicrobiales bacterium]|nr:helix-turn-helix domain-containing protein [Acidimicrobiales bacterium]